MKRDTIHLLVSFDQNYTGPFQVMVKSLAASNPSEDFYIWLLHSAIPDGTLRELEQYCAANRMLLTPVSVDRALFETAPVSKTYPQEMYYRLLAPLLLPDTLERVLYLDPDILVINPVRPLWELSLGEHTFAAASHSGVFALINDVNRARLGQEHDYFNTGVLLIGLRKARSLIKADAIFQCVREQAERLLLPDQDVFNVLYGDQTLQVDDAVWNYDARYFSAYLMRSDGQCTMDWVKDSKEIIPDEATAPVVCRIFELCAAGKGPNQIARILTREQTLNPTNQYYQATGTACNHLDTTRPYSWCGKTVANILENIVYLGHTLSMKHTTLSYKNKKQIKRPESEQILVKNTHAPLVSQELWEIVQEVRRHKRRPPKHMEEPNLFSGLVYCSDCGQYLVLCRTEKMREDQYYFRCSTYGKRGKDACTPHQIREADLKQIVLDDLRRVTHFARMKERQFAEYINQKNTLELRREINRVQKELDAMRRRDGELSTLFKRLYEDNVLGRVTNEQFRMLSVDYNAEQKELESAIPAKEEQLERLKASVANVDAFIEKAKQYTAIDELTPQLLRLFIQRIEIGERSKKHSRSAGQSVRIVYRDIGALDTPMREGDHAPRMTKEITEKEAIIRLLA